MKELLSRILVGIFFGPLFVFSALSRHPFLLIFLLIWLAFATKEFLDLLAKSEVRLNPYLFIPLNLLFIIFSYFRLPFFYFFSFFFLIFLWALFQTPFSSKYFAFGFFSIFYLGFLPSRLLLLKSLLINRNLSPWLLLFPIFFTWVNDTLAYGMGKALGKRKLAEKISPQKTWEGFLSSIFLSLPFSFFYLRAFLPKTSPFFFILLSFFLSILAQVGDLVESVFKREAMVKDTSNILLGHGGFLDRIDSLLFTIPAFYYFLILIL